MLETRDYTVLKSVRAVCPRCFAENPDFDPEYPEDICDGHLVDRDGSVYLRRCCKRGHGEVWSLYEEHAEPEFLVHALRSPLIERHWRLASKAFAMLLQGPLSARMLRAWQAHLLEKEGEPRLGC